MSSVGRWSRPRGQATVEAALGVTLVVSLVAFGIYLAEVGLLSLKVQESAISALWDGTAGKMHLIPLSYSEAGESMSDAATSAQRRYADFQGLSSAHAGSSITQALTRGGNLSIRCTMGDGPQFASSFPLLTLIYRDNKGTVCTAGADLTALRFPRSFLDRGSRALYSRRHLEDPGAFLRVCAAGRAVGGSCQGGYAMLVDDWGLAGALESPTCLMLGQDSPLPCPNLPFYAAVRAPYEMTALPIPRSASALAEAVLGVPSPINESQFFMSAPGEETHFLQLPPLDDKGGLGIWPTSPGSVMGISTFPYFTAYMTRVMNGNCFLGKECD